MLAGLIPDFVSQNPDVGKIECKHFFPDGYINAPEEVLYEDESDENKQTDEENIEWMEEDENASLWNIFALKIALNFFH